MVALGWHLGLCTGALSQKRNEGYYIINEAQMHILSELKVVLVPSSVSFGRSQVCLYQYAVPAQWTQAQPSASLWHRYGEEERLLWMQEWAIPDGPVGHKN